jgi:MFS transporter, ACDE family, multidrug resistance protein
VFGAPWLQARLGIAKTMYANLAAFAAVVLVIAIWTTDRAVLIPAVIISGIFIGVNNTITTQAVMTVSPVEKPVASAAYSFVRFIGGGLAPYAAGRMVLAVGIHFPFYIAAGAIALGIGILSSGHRLLAKAERVQAEQVSETAPVTAAPTGARIPVAGSAEAVAPGTAVIVAAVDGSPRTGRWSGTTWTGWPRTTSRPTASSCCTRPTTARRAGWWPSTPTPSGPARSWSARRLTAGCPP